MKIVEQIQNLRDELSAMRPLPTSLLATLREPIDLELTYSSNAIEGNTLTLRETAEVIAHGITIGGKPLGDHLEAIDHHHALAWMYDMAKRERCARDAWHFDNPYFFDLTHFRRCRPQHVSASPCCPC